MNTPFATPEESFFQTKDTRYPGTDAAKIERLENTKIALLEASEIWKAKCMATELRELDLKNQNARLKEEVRVARRDAMRLTKELAERDDAAFEEIHRLQSEAYADSMGEIH